MKYLLLWLQGIFELLVIAPIVWIVFYPYDYAIMHNKMREDVNLTKD